MRASGSASFSHTEAQKLSSRAHTRDVSAHPTAARTPPAAAGVRRYRPESTPHACSARGIDAPAHTRCSCVGLPRVWLDYVYTPSRARTVADTASDGCGHSGIMYRRDMARVGGVSCARARAFTRWFNLGDPTLPSACPPTRSSPTSRRKEVWGARGVRVGCDRDNSRRRSPVHVSRQVARLFFLLTSLPGELLERQARSGSIV